MNELVWTERSKAWIRRYPADALKVLLETGALEQCGWHDDRSDQLYSLRLNPVNDVDEPVYRLVTEEGTDG